MKKLLLSVCILAVIGILAVTAFTMFVAVQTLESYIYAQAHQPLWEQQEDFRNHQLARFQTNNAMADGLQVFWHEYARDITAEYSGFDIYDTPRVNHILNTRVRQVLSQGFSEDNIMLPFTQEYFDKILSNVYFYFALIPWYQDNLYGGLYVSLEDRSYIFVNTLGSVDPLFVQSIMEEGLIENTGIDFVTLLWLMYLNPSPYYADLWAGLEDLFIALTRGLERFHEMAFVHTTLHEVAHALGLGESLADLFAESAMGLDLPFEDAAFEATMFEGTIFEDIDLAREFIAYWDFDYNSTFDRSLLRYFRQQDRENEFWEAAFHSNAEFSKLWDEAFGQHISASELQTARGLFHEMRFEPSAQIYEQFEELSGGVRLSTAVHILLRNWNSFMYGEDTYNRYHFQFKWIMGLLNEIANSNGIEPQPSVLDFVIANHVHRYNN